MAPRRRAPVRAGKKAAKRTSAPGSGGRAPSKPAGRRAPPRRGPPGKPRGAGRSGSGEEDLLAIAERAVERALSRGADGAEAFVQQERDAGLRIERGVLSNGSVARDFGIGLRVLAGGRLAFAYLTDLAELDAALSAALATGRVLRPAPGFEFPAPARYPRVERLHDPRVAAFTVEDGADACEAVMAAAVDAAPGMTLAGGGLSWGDERVAIANSAGARGAWRGTRVDAALYGVLGDGDGTTTGFASRSSRRLDVDFGGLGAEAADLALRSRGPTEGPSGESTVLFKPSALDGLLEFLLVAALTGEAAASGQSVYAGRLGAEVLPKAYSLNDDGTLPGGVRSAPFDDEGVPSRRAALVQRGVLARFLDDVAGASDRGGKPTGSTIRSDRLLSGRNFRAPPRVTGRNLVVAGPGKALEGLVADVDDGFLVHDAMGAHTANPASGDFSVNATVVFRIENGEVTGPVKPLMVSGNLPRAFERLGGIGKDVETRPGAFSPVPFRVPTLRFDGLRVTGA